MSETPEKDKLTDRLFNQEGLSVRNIHIDWGPEAHKLTPEERAAVVNKVLDQIECGDVDWEDDCCAPRSKQPQIDTRELVNLMDEGLSFKEAIAALGRPDLADVNDVKWTTFEQNSPTKLFWDRFGYGIMASWRF